MDVCVLVLRDLGGGCAAGGPIGRKRRRQESCCSNHPISHVTKLPIDRLSQSKEPSPKFKTTGPDRQKDIRYFKSLNIAAVFAIFTESHEFSDLHPGNVRLASGNVVHFPPAQHASSFVLRMTRPIETDRSRQIQYLGFRNQPGSMASVV